MKNKKCDFINKKTNIRLPCLPQVSFPTSILILVSSSYIPTPSIYSSILTKPRHLCLPRPVSFTFFAPLVPSEQKPFKTHAPRDYK